MDFTVYAEYSYSKVHCKTADHLWVKLAYNCCWLDGLLKVTASTITDLSQYACSLAHYSAELAIS